MAAVAINGSAVVEVHKSQAQDTLWYRVAGLQGVFGDSHEYDQGLMPAVAVNNLNQVAQSPWGAGGLTHRVELKNLQPGTRYFFEVETGQARGTSGGQVESRRYTFQTPNVGQPPIQQQQPQPVR